MTSIGFYFDMSKIIEDKAKTEQLRRQREQINKYLREIRDVEESKRSFYGITDNIPKVLR